MVRNKAEKPSVVHKVATFFSSCDFCAASFGVEKRGKGPSSTLLLCFLADNLVNDEYRIPLPVERAGLAEGATKAALLLPIDDVMDSIIAATTMDDDDVDEEVIIDLERLLLLFI